MASVELPGEDFPTVDTNLRIPAGQMLGNYLFGPAYSQNWGNHASTFGTNPELMGTYFSGQNYPYTQGYGSNAQTPFGTAQGYGAQSSYAPQGYDPNNYGGGIGSYGSAQASSPIEGGVGTGPGQQQWGNNDFTHPGPPSWGAQQGMFSSVTPTLQWAQGGGYQAIGPQYGGNYNAAMNWQPSFMNNQTAGSLSAYYGGQAPGGQGQGAFDRFNDAEGSYNRRYATGVTDAQGNQILPSWEQLTGERGAATLGGYNQQPGVNGPGIAQTGANTDIYKAFQNYMQSQGAVPGGDPYEQFRATGGINQTGPDVAGIVRRGIGGTAGAVNQGIGGVAGLRGQYDYSGVGDLGINRTSQLGTTLQDQLSNDIDTRAQRLVANKLQQTQATMEAMGLGASGAGQRQIKMNNKDILDEATRNKNSLLAQFQEANAQRQAAAIGRATDLTGAGMRDMMGYQANIMGQGMGLNANAIGQGMGLEANAAEAGRQRLSSALGAGMDRASNVALDQQQRILAALQGGDQAALARQMGQAQIQGQGLQEYMGLQNTKDQMRSQRLQEMLGLEDRMTGAQQKKLDDMLKYGMLPMDWLTGMIGMSGGGSGPISKGPNGWQQAMSGVSGLMGGMGSMMSGAGSMSR